MEVNKIIHYCWFGPKPLSKLAKKCIESWKKYLPDYEIKLWNEDNFDFNVNVFVKEAYENKKWAFVADYARLKAIYDFGGIYLDTDMEIIKNIDEVLKNDLVLGIEDSKLVNGAIIYSKYKENNFIKQLLNVYDDFKTFKTDDIYTITIPANITKEVTKLGYNKQLEDDIQSLNNGEITIYPQEYFYPLSYDHNHNKFTDNTYMIHHYDATWASKQEKIKMFFIRRNMKFMIKVVDLCLAINRRVRKIFKINK